MKNIVSATQVMLKGEKEMLENDEFEVKANMGLVMRGSIRDMDFMLTQIKELMNDLDSQIVFKEVSANKLWISKEPQEQESEY